ncbi:MAG: hypothetical protein HKP60_11920, partial [Eudoraea sp.]|nr:hypothetical protein [Eudoraea sp.]
MKNFVLLALIASTIYTGNAQEIIELPNNNPENISWDVVEREYYSPIWMTQV